MVTQRRRENPREREGRERMENARIKGSDEKKRMLRGNGRYK